MSVVVCRSCQRNVFPKSDNTCPNCGSDTTGSAAAPELTDEERVAARIRDQHCADETERRRQQRRAAASAERTLLIGVALLLIGGIATFVSYQSSGVRGDTFYVWNGAFIVGASLIVRGLVKRSSWKQ